MNQNILFSFFLIISLTACGQGFKTEDLESSVEQSENQELTQIETESQDKLIQLDLQIAELEKINFKQFENPKASLSSLIKMKSSISDTLKGLTDSINKLKAKLTDLKQKIQSYIELLDPNDPNQKQIIDRLNQLLERITKMEKALDTIVQLLKDKLQFMDQIFDQLIGKLDPNNPTHMILRMVIEAIKELIKAKLKI